MPFDSTVPSPPSFSTDEELEGLLLEGLNSEDATTATPEFWAELKQQWRTRFEESRTGLRKAS